MKHKNFIKIINEEISEFDYLNNEQYLAEQEDIKRLQEEFFQKQFIMDSITRMRDKIELLILELVILILNWENHHIMIYI